MPAAVTLNSNTTHALSCCFSALQHSMLTGVLQIPETVLGLPVFYKQRENKFYPAWCYALPKTILDLPLSIWEALLWTAIPYFAVGYYRDAGRYSVMCFLAQV